MTWIYLALALTLTAGAVYGVNSYNDAIAEAERLSGELTKANASAESWKAQKEAADKEIKRRDDAVASRDAANRRIARELDNALQSLERLKTSDPEVRDWAARPLPRAILDRLREPDGDTAPAGSIVPGAAGNPARGDAAPDVPGRN